MNFKKAKVVMLPTNQKAKEGMIYLKPKIGIFNETSSENHNNKVYDCNPQHLYIISDDEIKEGDWFYNIHSKIVGKAAFNFGKDGLAKKIIATTDISLTEDRQKVAFIVTGHPLPQPSQQFIQKYIEEYNRGNIITDVLVEYELISNEEYFLNTINPDENVPYFDEDLKINPKYNTISIKKVKDSYTKEEVDRMLDEQASKTTAEMMEKFKDYKSREEIKSLLFKLTNHFDLKRNIEITLDMQSKWLEENL